MCVRVCVNTYIYIYIVYWCKYIYIHVVICTHTYIYIYPWAFFLLLEGDRATPSRLLVAAGPCAARSRDRCETDSVLLARATWCNMNLRRYFLCYNIQYCRVHVYSFTSSLDEAEYLGRFAFLHRLIFLLGCFALFCTFSAVSCFFLPRPIPMSL